MKHPALPHGEGHDIEYIPFTKPTKSEIIAEWVGVLIIPVIAVVFLGIIGLSILFFGK